MKHRIKFTALAGSLALLCAAPLAGQAKGEAEVQDAQQQVSEATKVVQQMKQDPALAAKIEQAKGIFIIPEYGRGALVVGGAGGEGVALTHDGQQWNGPVFYNFGAISLGAQAGVEAGSIAMLLMTDKAVQGFRQDNKFSIDANAGLTIIDYSARARASAGRGDIIVWSDTEGALVAAAVAVSDIQRDDTETEAFFGMAEVTPQEIFDGKAEIRNEEQQQSVRKLESALKGETKGKTKSRQ